jgi:tetratricopeptide (TPR) repeat protein
MQRLRHPLGMHDEAQSVMRAVSTEGMSDEELRGYADFVAGYEGEEVVLGYFARIKDPVFAAKARFDYYYARTHRNRPFMEKALAQIPTLQQSPKYANEVIWAKAVLLQWLGRFEEAIKAFQAANRQPDSTWAITDCLVGLKQYGEAIKTVQALEMVGGQVAASACLKVADIYNVSGDKSREVQQLRLVLRRYPKSGPSSTAHTRLESYGVALIGGEAKADE